MRSSTSLNIYSKRRKDRLLSAAFTLVLVLLALPVFPAHAKEEDSTEAASLSLQSYAPARIVITYTYTNNFSVSDVSAMGRPEYKIISGPTSIEFKTDDTDRFTFTVEIKYAAVVGQSIQVALFSAGYPPEGIQLNVKTSTVRIRITLTVTEEPRYPSAQDVAEQVVRQVANQLMMFRHQTDETLQMQSRNIEVQWMILTFNTAISIGLLVFIVHWVWPLMKRLRAEEAEAAASTFTEESS